MSRLHTTCTGDPCACNCRRCRMGSPEVTSNCWGYGCKADFNDSALHLVDGVLLCPDCIRNMLDCSDEYEGETFLLEGNQLSRHHLMATIT